MLEKRAALVSPHTDASLTNPSPISMARLSQLPCIQLASFDLALSPSQFSILRTLDYRWGQPDYKLEPTGHSELIRVDGLTLFINNNARSSSDGNITLGEIVDVHPTPAHVSSSLDN